MKKAPARAPPPPQTPVKGGRKKKEEGEQKVWKWWEEEKKDDGTKWYFLQHKGSNPSPRLCEKVQKKYGLSSVGTLRIDLDSC